jgi:DNA-binding MarR family transcriptional regulator
MKGASKNPAVPLLTGLVRTIRDCCQRQEGVMCRKLALTPSQFACLVAMPEPAAEPNVHQVVRAGLLARRTLDQDRRTQLVSLTAAGQEKWQEAQRLLTECERRLLAHLPPQRTRELAETLKTLIRVW